MIRDPRSLEDAEFLIERVEYRDSEIIAWSLRKMTHELTLVQFRGLEFKGCGGVFGYSMPPVASPSFAVQMSGKHLFRGGHLAPSRVRK